MKRRLSLVSLCFLALTGFSAHAQTTYTESLLASLPSGGPKYPQYVTLVQASDGNFYGTSYQGGTNNDGTVFQVTPAGVVTTLHSFAGGTSDGANPVSGLIQGSDGNLYGTASSGGSGFGGVIFRISLSGTYTVIHNFNGNPDGTSPDGTLVQGTDGFLYGTTTAQGANRQGVVFKISTVSPYTETILHAFKNATTDASGAHAGLVEGTDGFFYGVTSSGGASGDGAVFQVSSAGSTFNIVHSFNGTSEGEKPFGNLIQGSNGNLFGTNSASSNGSNAGTAFSLPLGSSESLDVLYTFLFSNSNPGETPYAPLFQATDGNLYGTGSSGGNQFFSGSVYYTTPTGSSTELVYAFPEGLSGGIDNGTTPYGGVIQGSDGNFYGTAMDEGTAQQGAIYKVTVSPALPPPVQLTAPATVTPGEMFSMSYLVANSYDGTVPGTMNYCFATNNAGDTTGWTGTFTGEPTAQVKTLTASSTLGTYTYTLTCGGIESGFATVTVAPPPSVVTFTSVTHNFGSELIGTAATAYGLTVKNTGTTNAYPFSLVFTPANGFTSANNCGTSIAAGATCEIVFYFTPTAAGTVSAPWSLAPESGFIYSPSNGGTLTGSGAAATGSVTLTTNGHNFGTQAVGTASGTYGTELTNSSNATETITLGPVPSGPFTMLTNCGTTLAAGASCEIEFTFTPTTTSTVQVVVPLSGSPTAITSGGVALPSGGITLTGN